MIVSDKLTFLMVRKPALTQNGIPYRKEKRLLQRTKFFILRNGGQKQKQTSLFCGRVNFMKEGSLMIREKLLLPRLDSRSHIHGNTYKLNIKF